jgi:Uncharacterized conserved protein
MKFTLDADQGVNLIRSYARGEVRIGERVVQSNCIVSADAVITDWSPLRPADLEIEHLEPIFRLEPQVVLLGTGATQLFPARHIRAAFIERGIGLEAMDLGAACRTFNILVQEGRRVAAALFLE